MYQHWQDSFGCFLCESVLKIFLKGGSCGLSLKWGVPGLQILLVLQPEVFPVSVLGLARLSSGDPALQDSTMRPISVPDRSKATRGTGVAPDPGTTHLPGDSDWLRQAGTWACGRTGLEGPWQGEGKLRENGDQTSCGLSGTSADGNVADARSSALGRVRSPSG